MAERTALDSRPAIACRRCRSPPSRRRPSRRAGGGLRGLRRAARLVGRTIRAPSGTSSGISAASSARRARAGWSEGRSMRETRFFPDARLNFAENLLRRARRRIRRSSSAARTRSSDGSRWDELARSSRACSRRCGRRASAPATASPRCCRTCRRRSRSCSPPPRSARSSPPARRISASAACSTVSGRSSQSCFFAVDGYWYNGKAIDVARQGEGDRRASCRARRRPSSCPISAAPTRSRPRFRAATTLDAFIADFRAGAARLRAAALRSSALHPLLLRHDRRAEMHRARRRRHAAAAPEGAPAALLAAGRREALLLHHARLDDVELARLRPRQRRDAPPLRRLAVPSRRQCALRLCRGGEA